MADAIAFIDLAAQQARIRGHIDAAIKKMLDHGQYIMGPEVAAFEGALGEFAGASDVVSCSSGTDAVMMPLMAWGIQAGDAVFCPSFTFAATAEVVALLGATPVFVDVEADSMNMDPAALERAIEELSRNSDLRPRAVIAVDLFGRAADYPAIRAICDQHGLKLLSDAAQGLGATIDGKHSLHWADVVATSFFPAKPLGCYGDGGAILTNDAVHAATLRSLRVHGKGRDKYDCVRIGLNGRLDTLQAAILIEKLKIFPDEIERRNVVAQRYAEALGNVVKAPKLPTDQISVWAQYTVQLPEADKRSAIQQAMKAQGVPTAVYYPLPLHRQKAYEEFPVSGGALPVSDGLSEVVMSLPMHPYLQEAEQDRVIEALKAAL